MRSGLSKTQKLGKHLPRACYATGESGFRQAILRADRPVCSHSGNSRNHTYLGHLPTTKRTFLPLNIEILFNLKEDKVFSEISYDRKQNQRVHLSGLLSGERKKYFADAQEQEDCVVHRSRRRRTFTWKTLPAIYRNLCGDYEAFDICGLLTHDGYRYYCDLGTPSFHHLCYAFMLMFYVGTVTRYRPSEAEALLQGDLLPLISEAIASCPDQFLYQLTSLITASVCVVPHSSLSSYGRLTRR